MANRAAPVRDERVYQWLQNAIATGELSPGERLVEEELAERLGETRGVIHTALIRLSHDGVIVREHHRGAHVRRISVREAIEVLEARRVVESLAAGYAAIRRTDKDVEQLRRILEEMEQLKADGHLLELSALNSTLHHQVLEISDHAVATRVSRVLRPQVVRFQFRTVLATGRADHSLAEHTRLVEAIEAGDRPGAEAAMHLHLTHVLDTLEEIAARDPMLA
jgi:DNA-binding GntR family transcriptional regulator